MGCITVAKRKETGDAEEDVAGVGKSACKSKRGKSDGAAARPLCPLIRVIPNPHVRDVPVDAGEAPRSCAKCGQTGHYASTCAAAAAVPDDMDTGDDAAVRAPRTRGRGGQRGHMRGRGRGRGRGGTRVRKDDDDEPDTSSSAEETDESDTD